VFAQNVRGVTANSIKIGVQVPLTGPVALSGEQIRAGEVAYMSMINDRGGVNGRKIELIIEDNEFSAQKGVTAVRKLVTRDNVFAMVGGNGVSQFNPVLPFLDEQQVPVINAYTGVVDWYNPVRQRVFGVYPPLEFSAQAIGRWAAKEGHKKILVAHFDAAIAVSFSKMIEPGAKTANPNVEVELMPVKLGTVDYTPIALEIMRKNPDVVIAANILQEFVALTKELRTQGSKVPVFTLPINVLQSVLALAPEPLEGVKALSFTRSPTADTPGSVWQKLLGCPTGGSGARARPSNRARAGSLRSEDRCRGSRPGRSRPRGRSRPSRGPRAATARFDPSPWYGELEALPQTCRRPSPWGSVSLGYSSSSTYRTSPFWGDCVEHP